MRDDGLVRVGWSSTCALRELGTDNHSFGYGGAGMKSHAKTFTPYGQSFGAGDAVGCCLDSEAGEVLFSLNGAQLGVAFALPAHLRGCALFPALCLKNAEAALNFGGAPFAHAPPPGFAPLAASPLLTAAAQQAQPRAAPSRRTPRCLVLEPVRDLAQQTAACLSALGAHLSAPALAGCLLVGGCDPGPALRLLRDGCDLVTGTPACVLDAVQSGRLDLRRCRFLVLDEADRLLEAGSCEQVLALFRALPSAASLLGGARRLQVLLFSATLHSASVTQFSAVLCERPTWVDLKGCDYVPDSVHHAALLVSPEQERWQELSPTAATDNVHARDAPAGAGALGLPLSRDCASAAVKRLKPHLLLRLVDALRMDRVLVFCRTNFDCDNLEAFLRVAGGGGATQRLGAESGKENPYSCCVLAGGRSTEERRRSLQAFKDGAVRMLLCTDVAARGIDISGLPFVVNMTLPDSAEDYIHRVGRVGRADTLGLAVSLVSRVPERLWYCRKKGHTPWTAPTEADVREHSVWSDEHGLLKAVEERLGCQVPTMGHDCALPQELRDALPGGGGAGTEAYGQAKGEGAAVVTAATATQQLAPTVQALSDLEHTVQRAYWALKRKYTATEVDAHA